MSTLKHAATLSVGNGIAQLISLAGLAMLAHLYTPAQFGLFAIVTGVATVASVAAACRYDMTILLPRSDERARLALFTALTLAALSTVWLALLVGVLNVFTEIGWTNYWLEIAILTFSIATVQTFNVKRNREKRYQNTVLVQILRSIGIVGSSALLWRQPDGLIHGYVLGSVGALLITLAIEYRVEKRMPKCFPPRRLVFWLRRHAKFFQYTLPAVLVGSFSSQLPVFLIAAFFGPQGAGYYSFINRTVMAPVSLISGSLKVVFMREIAHMMAIRRPLVPAIAALTRRLSGFSALAAACFVTFCLLDGYRLVFGEEWAALDALAIVLTPVLAVSFVSRCLPDFAVVGRNALGLVYQLAIAAGAFISIYAAHLLWVGRLEATFVAYSLTVSILYLGKVVSMNWIARMHDRGLVTT